MILILDHNQITAAATAAAAVLAILLPNKIE